MLFLHMCFVIASFAGARLYAPPRLFAQSASPTSARRVPASVTVSGRGRQGQNLSQVFRTYHPDSLGESDTMPVLWLLRQNSFVALPTSTSCFLSLVTSVSADSRLLRMPEDEL